MNPQDLLLGAFIYLAAAVIAAPVATRLGLGSVLGYLVAGMVIGPSLLGLVGQEEALVAHAGHVIGHPVQHLAHAHRPTGIGGPIIMRAFNRDLAIAGDGLTARNHLFDWQGL